MPLDLSRIRASFPGREIRWFETIGSTMTEASRLAAEGCASGTVVVADEQTAGQGRHGRQWHSESETGLYASVVLRLSLPVDTLPVVTLALGLAVQDAITRATGIVCDLRWPNDVMAGGKKCAGILVQLVDGAIVAGIGINVNHSGFPEEIGATATSLRIVSGRAHSREALLSHLLEAVEVYCRLLVEEGKEQLLRLYCRSSSFAQNRRVVVHQEREILEGTTEGLDESGFLILRKTDGTRTLILAGGVRPVE